MTRGAVPASDPGGEALRHRRRGAWLSWSHGIVSAHAERLAAELRARGLRDGSLVAVSGDMTPNLVLFALAAGRLGAAVAPLSPALDGVELAAWLDGHAPALVFLGSRDALDVWRAALLHSGRRSEVVADVRLPWEGSAGSEFAAAASLFAAFEAAATPAGTDCGVLWIEEGTEWAAGLSTVLRAVADGRPLAFPESRAAANRDRAVVQPRSVAVSSERHAALVGELAARLPVGRSVAARLTRWALQAGREARERWYHAAVLRRLRRPFGLSGLRDLVVVGPPGDPSAPPAGDLLSALGIVVGHAVVPVPAATVAQPEIAFA